MIDHNDRATIDADAEKRHAEYDRKVQDIVEIARSDDEPSIKSQKLLECIAVTLVDILASIDLLRTDVELIADIKHGEV